MKMKKLEILTMHQFGKGDRFQQPRNQRDEGFLQDKNFSHRGVEKYFRVS